MTEGREVKRDLGERPGRKGGALSVVAQVPREWMGMAAKKEEERDKEESTGNWRRRTKRYRGHGRDRDATPGALAESLGWRNGTMSCGPSPCG